MSKVILITGVNSNSGKQTAITMAGEGHSVIGTVPDILGTNLPSVKELMGADNMEVIEMDIRSDQSVQQAITYVIQRYGKIDVLVNNESVSGYGVTEAHSIEVFKKVFEINFYGAVRTYAAVLPFMRTAKCGLIINLSAGASAFSLPYLVPYLSSKFAMETMVEGIDSELKNQGIENVSLQCELSSILDESDDYNADKLNISNQYADSIERMSAMKATLNNRESASLTNSSRIIADGIKKLVDMHKGSRPLRYSIDHIAQGTDEEFISAKAKIKRKWVGKYGLDI